jgi:Ca2+-binding RTX toxin-like protein
MRRFVLLVCVGAATLLLAAGTVLAATVRCGGGECKGTPKADKIIGTSKRDVMRAFGGSDKLYAKSGEDDLYGQFGADRLYGAEGSDLLSGGDYPDALYGGEGDDQLVDEDTDLYQNEDTLKGGKGDDLLNGGGSDDRYVFDPGWGHDTISDSDYNADPSIDTYWGNTLDFSSVTTDLTVDLNATDGIEVTAGTNTIDWGEAGEFYRVIGGAGDDTIMGDETNNVVRGGAGADTISGGDTQDDKLYGEDGDDKLFANSGAWYDEELNGGKGDDLLDGGEVYNDVTFWFGSRWGHDTITGNFGGGYLSTVARANADMTIDLNPGDGPEVTDGTNTIDLEQAGNIYGANGDDGDDDITGDDGYNYLSGHGGADTIRSGGGDDTVHGGRGADRISSGDGNDDVYAFYNRRDSGVDRVDCGAGEADVVYIQKANAEKAVNCEEVYFTVDDDY